MHVFCPPSPAGLQGCCQWCRYLQIGAASETERVRGWGGGTVCFVLADVERPSIILQNWEYRIVCTRLLVGCSLYVNVCIIFHTVWAWRLSLSQSVLSCWQTTVTCCWGKLLSARNSTQRKLSSNSKKWWVSAWNGSAPFEMIPYQTISVPFAFPFSPVSHANFFFCSCFL